MGAVFALYSAWYFWIPKILGVDYNRSWGKVHFWILFIGVNVTFFPQHFLGLQGMPRRISDYADAFAGWNMISSIGSIISVTATLLFLHTLYIQLTEGKPIIDYIWLKSAYFFDLLQALIIRSYDSLEWALNSPPKPHAFVSLPVQSGLPPRKFNRFWAFIKRIRDTICTKNFIFSCMIVFLTSIISRYFILMYWDVNVFSDMLNGISAIYYVFMSVYIPLTRVVVSELCNPGVFMMDGDPVGGPGLGNPSGAGLGAGNPSGASNPSGVGGGNPPAVEDANSTGLGGTLRANKTNGPMVVADPAGQNFQFNEGGSNQPQAGELAKVLEHQRRLGVRTYSRYMFTDPMKKFFFDVLRHEDPKVHDYFFLDKHRNPTDKQNWYIENHKNIWDVLKKAK